MKRNAQIISSLRAPVPCLTPGCSQLAVKDRRCGMHSRLYRAERNRQDQRRRRGTLPENYRYTF